MKAFSGISIFSGAIILALAALPQAASAAHGKAGLWNVTVSMEGMTTPQMSPGDMARMKSMGIEMPDRNTVSIQHCMTAAEVNSDRLPAGTAAQQGCTMNNMQSAGHMLSSDMICTGNMKGEGHMALDYDSPEHYSGKMTFNGTAQGQPANITYMYDGKWASADCGGVDH